MKLLPLIVHTNIIKVAITINISALKSWRDVDRALKHLMMLRGDEAAAFDDEHKYY